MTSITRKHNHKNFNQAAQAAYNTISSEAGTTLSDPEKFTPIQTFISRWVKGLSEGDYNSDDLELVVMVAKRAGVEAMYWLTENLGTTMPDIVELVCKKQHDYGHQNINNFGLIGVGIRLCDKIARIKNLEKTVTPQNESLVDSYVDIVGYAIIAIMLGEDSFQLQLKGISHE
jgi:hypothetical protein